MDETGKDKESELIEKAWGLLGALPKVEPSPDFYARFWEKVREEKERKVSWLSFPRLAPALAGALGVWILGVGIGSVLFMRQYPLSTASSSLRLELAQAYDSDSLSSAYLKRIETEEIR